MVYPLIHCSSHLFIWGNLFVGMLFSVISRDQVSNFFIAFFSMLSSLECLSAATTTEILCLFWEEIEQFILFLLAFFPCHCLLQLFYFSFSKVNVWRTPKRHLTFIQSCSYLIHSKHRTHASQGHPEDQCIQRRPCSKVWHKSTPHLSRTGIHWSWTWCNTNHLMRPAR